MSYFHDYFCLTAHFIRTFTVEKTIPVYPEGQGAVASCSESVLGHISTGGHNLISANHEMHYLEYRIVQFGSHYYEVYCFE